MRNALVKREAVRNILVAVLILVAAFVVFTNGPTSYRLQRLEDAAIPQELHDRLARIRFHGAQPRNVVWRLFRDDGQTLVAAATFSAVGDNGRTSDMYMIELLEQPGAPNTSTQPLFGNMSEFRLAPFYGQAGSGISQPEAGEMIYSIHASGVCLNPKISTIRGTTSEGRTLTVTPDSGFWFIYFPKTSPGEVWKAVEALNNRGRVLYELPMR